MFDGIKLKRIREKKKLSYTEFIYKLYDQGIKISRPTIQNWENNVTTPKANELAVMADFFKVKIDYFFTK